MRGWRGLGLAACAALWSALTSCSGSSAPEPGGSGGLLATGGAASGGSGSGGGQTYLCPPPYEDCCYENLASYYCSGDRACKGYPLAIDCGKSECGEPCEFGCLGGRCLPDPSATTGGTAGLGGGGLGGAN